MAMESESEQPSISVQVGDLINDYAIVVYPLLLGISLIGVGGIFELIGSGVNAGVAAATGLIICALTLVVYVLFWLVGRLSY